MSTWRRARTGKQGTFISMPLVFSSSVKFADGRKPTEKLFLRANGKAWKESEQQRPMDAAREAANGEGVTFHILRHTYASHSLMNGMTINVLAKQLGHRETRIMLRHYAHLCPQIAKQPAMKECSVIWVCKRIASFPSRTMSPCDAIGMKASGQHGTLTGSQ